MADSRYIVLRYYCMTPSSQDLSLEEYRGLAEFRTQIRRFLHFSEQSARANGIEPQQHQLLLAIKGLPEDRRATIGELAGRLCIQHHSAVELVNRMVERGAVARIHPDTDRREVIVRLTRSGEAVLSRLSVAHHEELETVGPALAKSLRAVIRQTSTRKENGVI
jgi:DNA-binding MarR family transcriptional regulator